MIVMSVVEGIYSSGKGGKTKRLGYGGVVAEGKEDECYLI